MSLLYDAHTHTLYTESFRVKYTHRLLPYKKSRQSYDSKIIVKILTDLINMQSVLD